MDDVRGQAVAVLANNEVSRLLHLIDQAHGQSAAASARDRVPYTYAPPTPDDSRNGLRLPALSALFPAFSTCRSNGGSAYPTPTPSENVSPPTDGPPRYVSPYASPEQHAIKTHYEAIRRGFAFHRTCNRHVFIAYDEQQFDQLLADYQTSLAESRPLTSVKECELFSACVIAATFNRVEIPAGVSDVFYRAASERFGNWVLSQPITAMRCCALLGLTNLFQKATIAVLYFDLALALAHNRYRELDTDALDIGVPEHVELQQIWRSLVFGRAWLQSTIGACTSDHLLWLPTLTIKADQEKELDVATQIRLLVPIEIARISVLAAKAMRVLLTCSSPYTLLPAVQDLFGQIGVWYDGLPSNARVDGLAQTPWDDSKVCLAYVHLGHFGAITLIFRKTLSIYDSKSGHGKHSLQGSERSQLAAVFNDGIVAAKQVSEMLHLFLGEQAGIRHCWTVIYSSFVSAAILLYCISQMQLHDYPESEWQPYLRLVDNDMEVLAYCQELDPVAGTLRDTLSQYMQFLRIPSRAPKRKPTPAWARAVLRPPSELPREAPHGQDLVDLLLSVPAGRAGPTQTSKDLLKLVCQPFNDTDEPRSSPCSGGYRVPHVLGNIRHDAPREKWGRQASDTWMPFGWQQCQSSTAFTGKSTNLALTMAQQEMLRAGV